MAEFREVTWDVVYCMFRKEIIDSIRLILNNNGVTKYHIAGTETKGIPFHVSVFGDDNTYTRELSDFVNKICIENDKFQELYMRNHNEFTDEDIEDHRTIIHAAIDDISSYIAQQSGYRIINDIPYEVVL